MFSLNTSNPALTNEKAFNPFAYGDRDQMGAVARPTTATLQGVVNKTGIFAAIAVAGGVGGYSLATQMPGLLWIVALAGFVVTLGIGLAIGANPARAKGLGFVYAAVEGLFLGAVTSVLDAILVGQGIQAVGGGLALQAFVITISVMLAMLALYSIRIIKPGKTFVAVLSTLTLGIGIMYLVGFVMAMFGAQLPFLSIGSAMEGGNAALIGLGINVVILGVAALWLIVDFQRIEQMVDSGAPRSMEWYGAFALLVSLAWVYYEAVKLCFRLAMLFGRRD